MARLVEFRRRRASEQEQPLPAEVVDAATHGVPHAIDELILVDQPGRFAVQGVTKVRLSRGERGGVSIQTYFGCGEALRGSGLTNSLRPGQQDGPVGSQPRFDLSLDYALYQRHR